MMERGGNINCQTPQQVSNDFITIIIHDHKKEVYHEFQ